MSRWNCGVVAESRLMLMMAGVGVQVEARQRGLDCRSGSLHQLEAYALWRITVLHRRGDEVNERLTRGDDIFEDVRLGPTGSFGRGLGYRMATDASTTFQIRTVINIYSA